MEWRYAAVLVPIVWLACVVGIRRLGVRSSGLAGLVLLVALFLPTPMVVSEAYLESVAGPMATLVQVAFCLLTSLALVAASSLLCLAVSLRRRAKVPEVAAASIQAGWMTPAALGALAVLLLARTLYDLYWLMVWDSTTDSLSWFWLVPPVAATLVAGFLTLDRQGVARWAGLLYAPLVVCLMVAVFVSAKSVDFRELTESRAGEVQQAVETYYAREGGYPRDLDQLFPRYAVSLPEPVIIYGQGWCYDAGDGYFRLGYVDREHWSAPDLIGHLYASGGAAPEQPNVCQSEIAALKARQPSHW